MQQQKQYIREKELENVYLRLATLTEVLKIRRDRLPCYLLCFFSRLSLLLYAFYAFNCLICLIWTVDIEFQTHGFSLGICFDLYFCWLVDEI